ncbi:MAG: methylenetetrahydrofolate reductase C-terminal domain-containing protein [Deltaproteobacteria bacterium]|nr:methylenetetrahydrofolate reductase C-terminal domain-containing protein [Deltaproteobacteria bacterium]
MIRSITQPKPDEELERLLNGLTRLFIVGCGTCATLTRTGGVEEVAAMKDKLLGLGKMVTGTTVVPVACDELSHEILEEHASALDPAEALVIMSCAFGVQTIGRQLGTMVIPALDTLFIGKETGSGLFQEVCDQCGQCLLGETGGVCPVTACHKGLVNGPCGGTNNGKCEIDPDKDCAWTLIYNRLKELGKLDLMRRYQPPRNYNVEPQPGKFSLAEN